MPRIKVEYDGVSRGAVRAGNETVDSIQKVKREARAAAETQVKAALETQDALRREITEYKAVANTAQKGSREQVAAAHLAAKAERELAGSIGVTAREQAHLERTHARANQTLGQATRGMVAGSGAAAHLGRSIAFASTTFLGAAGFIHIVGESVRKAIELKDAIDESDVVFRHNSKSVQDWSKGLANSFGLASGQALVMANDVGQMLKGLEVAPDKTASWSKSIVQLSADIGELRGTDPAGFVAAFDQALAGRTRGLKAYGVFIDDTRLKAEALSLGLVTAAVDSTKLQIAQNKIAISQAQLAHATKEYGASSTQAVTARNALLAAEASLQKVLGGAVPTLTAAQRAAALYSLTMKQTADAHGFFKTQASDADNATKRFQAALSNLEEEVGTALLPTLAKYASHAADWLSKTENQEKVTHAVTGAVKEFAKVIDATWPLVKEAATWIGKAADAVGGFGNAIKLLLLLKVATWLGGMTTGLAGVIGSRETGLVGADAKAKSLHGTLSTLNGLAIAIPVNLILSAVLKDHAGPLAGFVGWLQKNQKILNLSPQGIINAASTYAAEQVLGWVSGSGGGHETFQDAWRGQATALPTSGLPVTPVLGRLPGVVTSPGGAYQGSPDLVPRHTFATRVSSPTAGLSALQRALVAHGLTGGDPAINYRGHVPKSRHYQGEALDIGDGGNPASLVSTWNFLVAHADHFAELYWNYGGFYQYGKKIGAPGSDAIPNHRDHIHVSFFGAPQEVAALFGIQSPPGTTPVKGAKTSVRGGKGSKDLTALALSAAKQAGIDPATFLSLVNAESTWNPNAKSSAGALGLTQLEPSSFPKMSRAQLLDPKTNLATGAKYLASLIAKYDGDVTLALYAYNWGPNRVDKWLAHKIPLPNAVRDYAANIEKAAAGGLSGIGGLTVGTKPPKPKAPPLVAAHFTDAVQRAKTAVAKATSDFQRDPAIQRELTADLALQDALAKADKTASGKRKSAIERALTAVANDIAKLRTSIKKEAASAEAAIRAGNEHQRLVDVVARLLGITEVKDYAKIEGKTTANLKKIQRTVTAQLAAVKREVAAAAKKYADVASLPDDLIVSGATDKLGRPLPPTTIGALKAKVDKLFAAVKNAATPAAKARAAAALAAGIDDVINQASTAVQASTDRFHTAFGTLSSRLLSGFERVTQDHLEAMRRASQVQIDALDRQTQKQLDALQRSASDRIARLQKDLKRKLAGISAAGAALTPEEQAYQDFLAQRDAEQRAQERQDANAIEDPVERAKRLRELDLADQAKTLQSAAEIARKARDEETQALEDALQEQEQAREQAIQDQLAAEQQAVQDALQVKIQALQDEETARERAYQDERDAQETQLTLQLAAWEAALLTGQSTYADFVKWMQGQQGAGGLLAGVDIPDPVAGMENAGATQGSAFSNAFIAELAAVKAALDELTDVRIHIHVERSYDGGGSDGGVAGGGVGDRPGVFGGTPGRFGGPGGFALGGRVPGRYLGVADTVRTHVTPGEEIIDRSLSEALRAELVGGRFRGGPSPFAGANITVLGTTEREVQRALASLTKPELDRIPSYRPIL